MTKEQAIVDIFRACEEISDKPNTVLVYFKHVKEFLSDVQFFGLEVPVSQLLSRGGGVGLGSVWVDKQGVFKDLYRNNGAHTFDDAVRCVVDGTWIPVPRSEVDAFIATKRKQKEAETQKAPAQPGGQHVTKLDPKKRTGLWWIFKTPAAVKFKHGHDAFLVDFDVKKIWLYYFGPASTRQVPHLQIASGQFTFDRIIELYEGLQDLHWVSQNTDRSAADIIKGIVESKTSELHDLVDQTGRELGAKDTMAVRVGTRGTDALWERYEIFNKNTGEVCKSITFEPRSVVTGDRVRVSHLLNIALSRLGNLGVKSQFQANHLFDEAYSHTLRAVRALQLLEALQRLDSLQ